MQTGREELSGVQEATEIVEETVTEEVVEDTAPEEKYDPKESVKDTVARIAKEIGEGNKDEGAEKAEEGDPAADKPADVKTLGRQPNKPDFESDPELMPPERLNAKEKQLFQNLPKGLKKAWHRAIKDVEAGGTRNNQEYQRADANLIVVSREPNNYEEMMT